MRDPSVGETLDQFQLTELLARSGMASIFKAVDTASGRTVALKVPHVQLESDVVFYERFRREDEIGQRLRHPNVVEVLATGEKSRMYMVMEYVEGRSLRALLGKHPLPIEQALDLARQICAALAYLHAEGVLHRDIKPENVLVTPEGRVKLLDFGIAVFASARRLTWGALSSAMGTPDYMAPEQIRGRRGDPRTDVYAVGTMLYEMLTGHLPYESPNPRALLRAKTDDEPRPPSWYVPGFDPSLEAILLRAIARNPRDRYPSAAELLRDLENPSAVPPRDPSTGLDAGRGPHLPRRVLVPVVVAIALAALASLVWLSSRYQAPTDRSTPAARGR
ncbi:MAG TPA: serine/threonine-protein kinase [Anaeromyxobacteraceae bacterium]|jgi:serine/threonine-protein kinase|nr:serine/threonine-protein kinase [Anaeromyxobacteraceae bacterium]